MFCSDFLNFWPRAKHFATLKSRWFRPGHCPVGRYDWCDCSKQCIHCACVLHICMRIAFIGDPASPGLLSHEKCLHSLAGGPKFKTICMHTPCKAGYGMLCKIYMQCIAIPTLSSHTYAWRTRGRRALRIKNPKAVTGNCHHLIFVICYVYPTRVKNIRCVVVAQAQQLSNPLSLASVCFLLVCLFVLLAAQAQQLSNISEPGYYLIFLYVSLFVFIVAQAHQLFKFSERG